MLGTECGVVTREMLVMVMMMMIMMMVLMVMTVMGSSQPLMLVLLVSHSPFCSFT